MRAFTVSAAAMSGVLEVVQNCRRDAIGCELISLQKIDGGLSVSRRSGVAVVQRRRAS
jgi:hypothetical protein